jgi:DNA-binding response OmpR family regulator
VVLRDRFTREGYCVDTVADGESALQLIEHAAYDLMILDVMLPGISSFEVCRELRGGAGTFPFSCSPPAARP